jgi:hypothetical protein
MNIKKYWVLFSNYKIKDCQVLATRISRELGGNDDVTALEVGAVNEKDLEKVETISHGALFHILSSISVIKCYNK